jgi:hypothetical protein
MDGPRIIYGLSATYLSADLNPEWSWVAYANSAAVHHGLVLWLYRTCMMEDHDHTFESLDGCLSGLLRLWVWGNEVEGDIPFGGSSVLATRTIPFLT